MDSEGRSGATREMDSEGRSGATREMDSEGRSGATRETDPAERRTLGVLVVCIYLALAITNFAWMFPVLTGIPVSQSTWNMEMWLPSWR